jgi:integrase
VRLNKKSIDAIRSPSRDQIFWDDTLKGFGLRLNPGGKRTFLIQYRNAQGRSRRVTIGPYGRLTPEEARTKARRLLSAVQLGDDQRRIDDRRAITVTQLCEQYFEKARTGLVLGRGGKKKKISTLETDEGRARRHVLPLLGNRLVRAVTPNDIREFIEGVTVGKTAGIFKTEKLRGKAVVRGGEGAARRATAMLSGIFSYAVRVGYCQSNPCHGVERTSDQRKSIRITAEEYGELGRAIADAEVEGAPWQFFDAARLIALTGLRRNEAVRLRVNEIDFAHRCIRLSDSKTGASVRPLGKPALQLLRRLARPGQALVFPGLKDATQPYGAFAKTWKRYIGDGLTPHALRHGFASAAFELGLTETIVAHLLGHSAARTTTQGYIRAPEAMVLEAADQVTGYIANAMAGETAAMLKLSDKKRGTA